MPLLVARDVGAFGFRGELGVLKRELVRLAHSAIARVELTLGRSEAAGDQQRRAEHLTSG